jgi:hypothetical protein
MFWVCIIIIDIVIARVGISKLELALAGSTRKDIARIDKAAKPDIIMHLVEISVGQKEVDERLVRGRKRKERDISSIEL